MQVLFVSNTHIGDAVLSTGVLNYLVDKHPKAEFTIVCGKSAAPLFKHVPRLKKIIILEKQRYKLHWFYLWKQCVSIFWDIIVDFRRSVIASLLLARRRYIIKKPVNGENPHRQMVAARALNLQSRPPLNLWLSEAEKNIAVMFIPEQTDKQITIALAPMANWILKMWPLDRYIELIKRITTELVPGKKVFFALSCSSKEKPNMQPLIDSIPSDRCILLVDGLSLLDVAACFKRCALFIGNDSGLMHMANAAGVPTVGLFGPSRDELYAPLDNARVVRTPESYDEIVNIQNAKSYSYSLVESIDVDSVFSTVQNLLLSVID